MRLAIYILFAAVASACATLPQPANIPQYSVVTRDDEFRGGTLVAMHHNFLPSAPGEPNIAVGAARIRLAPPDSAVYLWIVDSYGGQWTLMGNNEPLTFLVDDQRIRFDPMEASQRALGRDGKVVERGIYLATAVDIRRVANGSVVRVRIGGRTLAIERTMGAENIGRLRAFVRQHLG